MPISIHVKQKKVKLVLCLALCSTLGVAIPARSQTSSRDRARIQRDWEWLRKQTGAREFLDPHATISSYQKFYENEGSYNDQTALEITQIIAQLYWQELNDPQKALSIYDWGIKLYGRAPGRRLLGQSRKAIEESNTFRNSFTFSNNFPSAEMPAPIVDPRQIELNNGAWLVRHEKITATDFVAQLKPNLQETLWMLNVPRAASIWEADRALHIALISLIRQQSPQTLQPPEKLELPLLLALAEYYISRRDAEANKIYQILLTREFPADSKLRKLLTLNSLAEFYGKTGQYAQAAKAKLAIQTQTDSEIWIGNTDVEAARFYIKAGRPEEAEALYQKAENHTYGWSVGIALIDKGRALMEQHKYDEAIKVLSRQVTGQFANQIEPVKRILMGDAYYLKGDLLKAQENIQAAISAYYALPDPLPGEGLEHIFASAEKRLEMMNRWIKEPIQIDSNEIHITIDKNQLQTGPVFRRLRVRTYRDVPLTATINSKNITAQILSSHEWGQLSANSDNQESEKEVIIKVTALPQDGSNVLLTISSTQYEGFTVQVHIYLDVNET